MGKQGLKLVFWKSISSHTHAFFFLYSMLWGIFFKNQVIFFKNSIFPKFRLIQSVFRLIEIAFKILSESLSISINRNWFSINRKSWISFFKIRSWLIHLTFQKFLNFSLSPICTRLHIKFLSFSYKNFARFSSLQAGMSILPSLFNLFSVLHAFFHALKGYFWTMHKLGFLMYQALFCEIDQ